MEDSVEGELRHDDVGGDAGGVEEEKLLSEPALLGLLRPVLDVLEIPVVDVHAQPVDGQPGTAVHDPAAPGTDVEDLAWPALDSEGVGFEEAPVVDGEVPVAVRAVVSSRPRAPQGDSQHPG